jgi:hypothetical protein
MATIHRTTMAPGKLDLVGTWLPTQPWYRNAGRPPLLSRAGGFRLDDPAGQVGIEFFFVTDGTDGEETTYSVPLTYRGAPLAEAEPGLLGTSEHGVLGRRWIYDAAHDPVAIAQLLEFIGGRVQAQDQNRSDTPDPSVVRRWASGGGLAASRPLRVRDSHPGLTTVAVELADPSSARSVQGSLHLVRVLDSGSAVAGDDLGSVEAGWNRFDGSIARGPVASVR